MDRAVAGTGLILVVATALTAWAMACGGGGEPEVAGPPNAECWLHENRPEIDCSMEYMPGQVLVRFEEGVTQAEARALIGGYGLSSEITDSRGSPRALVCFRAGEESAWIETFLAQDAVKYAEYNYIARIPEACAPSPTAE